MKTFLTKDHTHQVSFNGPIRTGLFLESKKFLATGYHEFQKEFMNTLSNVAHGIWGASNFLTYGDGSEVLPDTVRGFPIVPQYFITRILKDDALLEKLEILELKPSIDALPFRDENAPPMPDDPKIEDEPPPASFLISSIEIRMNDFGYGSVIFNGVIRAHQDLSIVEFKDVCKSVGARLNDYSELFSTTFETVWQNTPKDILSDAAFVSNLKAQQNNQYLGHQKEIGKIINTVCVYEICCKDEESFQAAKEAYTAQIFIKDEKYTQDASLDEENMAVFIGHHNHIVIYKENTVTQWQRSLLRRVLQVKNVFYTMFEEISENLIHINSSINLDDAHPNPQLLEEKARILVEYHARTEFFRGVYDDYDNHLDPQSLKILRTIEDTWETHDRIYALKNQLELAKNIHDRLVQDLNAVHQKKLGAFILIFTVLGMISVIINLVEFTQAPDLGEPNTLRLATLMLMILVAVIFAFRIRYKAEAPTKFH
ncbi:MAG: hypothetical protein EA357_01770 [Micavibrio sp.]|nr:MAG: hypothetical protein EA357_01770 [Micavibrio sp.]